MAKAKIRKAKLSDAAILAKHMRAADISELTAMHGKWADLQEIVEISVENSKGMCWSAFDGKKMIGMGGIAKGSETLVTGSIGIPWVLGTSVLDRRPSTLTRATLQYLKEGKRKYSALVNYVDARHEKSIRWLKRLGFEFSYKPMPVGYYGMPFYSFYMRGEDV